MNKAIYDTFEQMLASVASSGRGIIFGRDRRHNEQMLDDCVDEARRRFRSEGGTAYIGFTHKGEPFYAGQERWRSCADLAECVFQMHIDHRGGNYVAILMR